MSHFSLVNPERKEPIAGGGPDHSLSTRKLNEFGGSHSPDNQTVGGEYGMVADNAERISNICKDFVESEPPPELQPISLCETIQQWGK
jgi:hypothetical protein